MASVRSPLASTVAVLTAGATMASVLLGSWMPSVFDECPNHISVIQRHHVLNALMAPVLPPPGPASSAMLSSDVVSSTVGWTVAQALGIVALGVLDYAFLKEHPHKRTRLMGLAGLTWIGTLVARLILGYVFSRAVGWKYPWLFFNGAAHECQTGLCTWLWTLNLATMPLWYLQSVIVRVQGRTYAVRLWPLQVALVMLACTAQDGLWFTISSCAATLAILPIVLVLYNDNGSGNLSSSSSGNWLAGDKSSVLQASTLVGAGPSSASLSSRVGRSSPTPPNMLPLPASAKRSKSLFRSPYQDVALVLSLCALALASALLVRHLQPAVPPSTAEDVQALLTSPSKGLVTILIVTAPRLKNPGHLWTTIESFLGPLQESYEGLYHMIVFTSFENHKEFSDAQAQLEDNSNVVFIHQAAPEVHRTYHKQRRDFALAIGAAAENTNSEYIMFVEDDFPVCEDDGWDKITSLLVKASRAVPRHCGVFVATGASGLIFRSTLAPTLIRLLTLYDGPLEEHHPDIIMQECLRGALPECSQCAGHFVTSQRMLMKHIGFNTSTTMHRYDEDQYQCGWRQPFNGEGDVITL